MQQQRLTICGAIAVATPLLVLASILLNRGDRALSPSAIPLQPLIEKTPRLYPLSQSLATAYRAWMMPPAARIVIDQQQRFLEFDVPFNLLEQGPDLSLILVTDPNPVSRSRQSPSALPLGKMNLRAGKHRYSIPLAITDSGPADTTLRQYQSVIIWCAEFNTMMAYAQLEFEALAATESNSLKL